MNEIPGTDFLPVIMPSHPGLFDDLRSSSPGPARGDTHRRPPGGRVLRVVRLDPDETPAEGLSDSD